MTNYNELKKLIEIGYDIEFSYKGKSYSITKTNKNLISFCEYYKEPKYFNTVDEFMSNAKINLIISIIATIYSYIDILFMINKDVSIHEKLSHTKVELIKGV